jgi:hypothetical protein
MGFFRAPDLAVVPVRSGRRAVADHGPLHRDEPYPDDVAGGPGGSNLMLGSAAKPLPSEKPCGACASALDLWMYLNCEVASL